ncbi:MAG: hypothetical protein ABI992_01590 [Chthoniobacterales bacterium]
MTDSLLRLVLILLFASAFNLSAGELKPGGVYHLSFQDVDGTNLSTSDGHVTIVTVVTRADEDKARKVADLVPDRYVGSEKYRYVTLVNFQGKLPGPFQGLTRAIIRNRLGVEARELLPDYAKRKITHDPRGDLHAIADFDGKAVGQLGLPVENDAVVVFLFNGRGELLARWNGVPPANGAMAKILAEAR